jgi:hypothetical protein
VLAKKILVGLNIISSLAVIALGYKFVASPMIAKTMLKSEYQELMFQCDNVMREHLIAKTRVMAERTKRSLRQLDAAEMGLVTCHDYDEMRKKMRIAGVSDQELALMGLEVIEAKAENLYEFVDIHEIKY